MRSLTLAVLAVALCAAPARAAQKYEGTLALHPGECAVIPIKAGYGHWAVGDSRLADIAALRDGKVVVTALKEGHTNLLTWNDAGASQSFAVNVGHAGPLAPADLRVTRGEVVMFHVPMAVQQMVVGDNRVADVQLRKGNAHDFLVNGQKLGRTDLVTTAAGSGEVKVYHVDVVE